MNDDHPVEPEIVEPDGSSNSEIALANEVLPLTLHILPLFERPFFPGQAAPLILEPGPWRETIEKIGSTEHHFCGLVLANSEPDKALDPDGFFSIGCVTRIHNPQEVDGRVQFIAEGLKRFRIIRWISHKPPFVVQVEYPDETVNTEDDELRAYAMAIINTIRELIPMNPLYNEELRLFLNRFSPNQPAILADFAASLSSGARDDLQQVLQTIPVLARMEKALILLKKDLEVAKLENKIRERVEEEMTDQQRNFFLREQLKAIQQELGISKDDRTTDIERFEARILDLELPEVAAKRIEEELNKFSLLETGSPEYAVTRNYLDWMTSLPWGKHTADQLDMDRARKILAEDHEGLDDVKERIIEFLAVGQLTGEISGSIILLIGPPGVGKTSIGRSIARTLGREFFRFSVGGMQDEAEIKGHRRTYIGAMPGKFIQSIKELGSANPIIMLDEVDKIGNSYRGDPASALLEVLDPEQNSEFLDHYLDVRFDLSKVLFICTANQFDTIPGPLLDRMEIIHLGGYITKEKVAIAKKHLWPRQLTRAGLKKKDLKIGVSALRHLINGYAREAGVRNLEKQLGRIIRKAAVKFLSGMKKPTTVHKDDIEDYLGMPLFRAETPMKGVGIVTGMAWTPMGGAILDIEATHVHDFNRGFKLTGQLGDVMQESAYIAYSYLIANAEKFDADLAFFEKAFLHLHVPAGATPKDGPSAGVTITTALLSLARNKRPKANIAMTGEISLTGQVLPVGGIREKVIAAKRSGIRQLIIPEANRRDFEEVPDYIRDKMKVSYATTYEDVAAIVFP